MSFTPKKYSIRHQGTLTYQVVRNDQQGAVIIVALMFLMFMTLMASYSFRGVVANQKVAGRQYSMEIADRAAEAGLFACQRLIVNQVRLREDGRPTVPYWPQYVYKILPTETGFQDAQGRYFWQIPNAWKTGATDRVGGRVESFDLAEQDEIGQGVRIPGTVEGPRCFVELVKAKNGTELDSTLSYSYRITVVGFGFNRQSQQMQQIVYQPYPGGSGPAVGG